MIVITVSNSIYLETGKAFSAVAECRGLAYFCRCYMVTVYFGLCWNVEDKWHKLQTQFLTTSFTHGTTDKIHKTLSFGVISGLNMYRSSFYDHVSPPQSTISPHSCSVCSVCPGTPIKVSVFSVLLICSKRSRTLPVFLSALGLFSADLHLSPLCLSTLLLLFSLLSNPHLSLCLIIHKQKAQRAVMLQSPSVSSLVPIRRSIMGFNGTVLQRRRAKGRRTTHFI